MNMTMKCNARVRRMRHNCLSSFHMHFTFSAHEPMGRGPLAARPPVQRAQYYNGPWERGPWSWTQNQKQM